MIKCNDDVFMVATLYIIISTNVVLLSMSHFQNFLDVVETLRKTIFCTWFISIYTYVSNRLPELQFLLIHKLHEKQFRFHHHDWSYVLVFRFSSRLWSYAETINIPDKDWERGKERYENETGASGENERREREDFLSWWCIVKIDFSHICSKRY